MTTTGHDAQENVRLALQGMRRIVIKVGSAVLTGPEGLDREIIKALSSQIADLRAQGKEIIVVSSGAIAAGRAKLPTPHHQAKSIPEKQALAALGQSRLMHAYEEAFAEFGLHVAQILLTREGLTPRHRYRNAKNTLKTLLQWDIVPIINENDTVATEELQFTDNDALAVLIVNLVEAEALICLSDIDGLYDRDPRADASARRISEVPRVDQGILAMAGDRPGRAGRGGMKSKLEAARMVTASGVPMVVVGGRTPGVIERVFAGEDIGTLFLAREKRHIHGRKPWIAFTLAREGALELDEGAVTALTEKATSLLAVGIRRVEGDFEAGACVICRDPRGEEIAVGISQYSAEELRAICGCHSDEICRRIGPRTKEEVIHRDDMVIL